MLPLLTMLPNALPVAYHFRRIQPCRHLFSACKRILAYPRYRYQSPEMHAPAARTCKGHIPRKIRRYYPIPAVRTAPAAVVTMSPF